MNVLYAVTECVPFIKTGGLADVAGVLPKELNQLGCEVRVILPLYEVIRNTYKNAMKFVLKADVYLNDEKYTFGLMELDYNGVHYYFIGQDELFNRDYLYGHFDDMKRFAFLNKAVFLTINQIDFHVDVLHINDWHYGMLPLMVKLAHMPIRTILSIHNLQYQGIYDRKVLEYCDIPYDEFEKVSNDYFVNFLKMAILTVDKITTVSETYAQEIITPQYGEGLDGDLNYRKYDLVGILNGIDLDLYNPAKDEYIKYSFDQEHLENKAKNKAYLQEFFGLPKNDVPVIGIISRMVSQKGFDLLMPIMDDLLKEDVQFIILGSGNMHYEDYFRHLSAMYPNKVKTYFGFNEFIAHLIYAGSDFLLIPSIFEPCGLTQMIAMRYGTIPIVRETGGLKDTVDVYNQQTLKGNGFGFKLPLPKHLYLVIEYALEIYKKKDIFHQIRIAGMLKEFTVQKTAKKYLDIY